MAFLTPNAHGEAGVVSSFVRNQLAQVRSAAHGLSDEQWHRRSTVSEFTLAALLDQAGLDHDPKAFRRIASKRSLYHWNADANQEY